MDSSFLLTRVSSVPSDNARRRRPRRRSSAENHGGIYHAGTAGRVVESRRAHCGRRPRRVVRRMHSHGACPRRRLSCLIHLLLRICVCSRFNLPAFRIGTGVNGIVLDASESFDPDQLSAGSATTAAMIASLIFSWICSAPNASISMTCADVMPPNKPTNGPLLQLSGESLALWSLVGQVCRSGPVSLFLHGLAFHRSIRLCCLFSSRLIFASAFRGPPATRRQ